MVAVVVLDLVLTWIGTPVGWLRQLVRVLSVGTVAANVVAGWPDPVATGLHAAAPLMVLAMIEAGRTVLLRGIGQAQGTLRDTAGPAALPPGNRSLDYHTQTPTRCALVAARTPSLTSNRPPETGWRITDERDFADSAEEYRRRLAQSDQPFKN